METPKQRAQRILLNDIAQKELEHARCKLYLASTQFTHRITLESLSHLIDAVYVQSELYDQYDRGVQNIELLIRFIQRLSYADLAVGQCEHGISKLAQQARIKSYQYLVSYCADFGSVHPMVVLSQSDRQFASKLSLVEQNLA